MAVSKCPPSPLTFQSLIGLHYTADFWTRSLPSPCSRSRDPGTLVKTKIAKLRLNGFLRSRPTKFKGQFSVYSQMFCLCFYRFQDNEENRLDYYGLCLRGEAIDHLTAQAKGKQPALETLNCIQKARCTAQSTM